MKTTVEQGGTLEIDFMLGEDQLIELTKLAKASGARLVLSAALVPEKALSGILEIAREQITIKASQ